MHLSPSQLGCKSTSQIVPDHAAFHCQAKRYSCSVARFLETASKRARAHSRLFVVKDISGSAAIDYLLQSCANWTIHWDQTMARTFALRVHQKKPIWPDFYISPVSWEATLFPDLSGLCAEIQAETLRTFRAPTTI